MTEVDTSKPVKNTSGVRHWQMDSAQQQRQQARPRTKTAGSSLSRRNSLDHSAFNSSPRSAASPPKTRRNSTIVAPNIQQTNPTSGRKAKVSTKSNDDVTQMSSSPPATTLVATTVMLSSGDSNDDLQDKHRYHTTSCLDFLDKQIEAVSDIASAKCRKDLPRGSLQFENLMHEFQSKMELEERGDTLDETCQLPASSRGDTRRRRLSWNPEVSILQIARIAEME